MLLYKTSYFQKKSVSKNKIKVGLDLSNYATKFVLKTSTGVNTSKFDKEICLARLKSDTDDLGY